MIQIAWKSDLLAIKISVPHFPFLYPLSSILNHLASLALKLEQSPLQDAMRVVIGPR